MPGARNAELMDMMHDGIRATVFRAVLAGYLPELKKGSDIAKSISQVAKRSEDNNRTLSSNRKDINSLSKMAHELQGQVQKFVV